MATFEDFAKLEILAGTVVEAKKFEKAKKPAYRLKIDFGERVGIKKSSAQITQLYVPDELVGKQVLAVVISRRDRLPILCPRCWSWGCTAGTG